MYMYIYIYIYICVCIYIHIYIYIYIAPGGGELASVNTSYCFGRGFHSTFAALLAC